MKNLSRLVGIQSDENCDEILKFLEAELKSKVKEIKILGEQDKILVAGLNTTLKDIQPIVLSGHIDTVKPNKELYKTNPYTLTQIGDRAYGLGSIDMKSFIAVVLDRMEEINKLNVPIVLALTTDEETELKSVELMIENFKEMNILPKMTIIGEPTKREFNLTSNACYEYIIKFYGKACHSSRIEDGINAICACAKLITFIENNQKNYELTSNCGVISGGEVVNKVPDYAELIFDIRSINSSDIVKFVEDIKQYIKELEVSYKGILIEMKNTLKIPAFNMEGNLKIKNMAKELNVKTNSFSGGCEAGYYTEYSGDAIIFGVGDIALAHKPNEYVEIEEYDRYSNQLISVLNCIKKYYY